MFRARTLLAIAPLALALAGPLPARADDVIPPKVLIRHFPQGQFCALPVSITFTAPATPITVTFTAVQFVDDGSGNLTWTDQSIDNVTIATTAQVAANTAGPPAGGNSENCYIGDPQPVSYFHFNRPGLTLDLLELFDTDPGPRGWDLSAGGHFSSSSGPRDVENDNDFTGGSIGLGDGLDTPDPNLTKSTSITVSSLTQGESYDLGAWWDVNFVRFPHDTTYLTISITTGNGTPVARRSWGGVKGDYR